MARVQGIQEKVHLPIYDSLKVDPGKQLFDVEKSSTLKFFVDVQQKTKLETNLQSASLLPHYNTFEARAMRVVIGDLPAEFPDDDPVTDTGGFTDTNLEITDDNIFPFFVDTGNRIAIFNRLAAPTIVAQEAGFVAAGSKQLLASITLTLGTIVDLIREARDSEDGEALLSPDDEDVSLVTFTPPSTFTPFTGPAAEAVAVRLAEFGGSIALPVDWLEGYLDLLTETQVPLEQQIESNNGGGNLIGSIVYNTVTSLYVGEKLMMQMPTYFFPAGAGPYSETGAFTTHGEPSPVATFRFAEPVFIDKQQNFRVEIEVPDTDTLKEFQRIYGPFQMWVILDGYMTRDVQ
jgi:hypothetical protein